MVLGAVCVWFVVMALDTARYRYSDMPFVLGAAGALAVAGCMYLAYLTFRANSFAVPVVRIQHERNQMVVDTGPHTIVRHPTYAGAVLYFLWGPLLLGSWIGLALAPVLIVLLGVRVWLEERMLIAELPGYADYARRVRWRPVPGGW